MVGARQITDLSVINILHGMIHREAKIMTRDKHTIKIIKKHIHTKIFFSTIILRNVISLIQLNLDI